MSLEIKRPDDHSTVTAEMAVYRNLFSCGRDASVMASFGQHLNTKQYMRWIALNDILQCGDYVDEIYFYNHFPDGSDRATTPDPPMHWDVHPWDYDDMFQRCHSHNCNEGVMDCQGNAFPLFYCAQSPLDGCLHSDPGLYAQYKATIRELLQIINPPAYRALALAVAEHMQRYFRAFPAVSSAMVSVDGHRDVWSETAENIATQSSRHLMHVSPAAEFTESTGALGFDTAVPASPQLCDAMRGDVCGGNACRRFVASGMSGRSCADYCCEFGLSCVGAWEERDNDCVQEEVWSCQQTEKRGGGTTDDVICECDGATTLAHCAAAPPAPAPSPPRTPAAGTGASAVWTTADSPIIARGQVNVAQLLAVEPGVRVSLRHNLQHNSISRGISETFLVLFPGAIRGRLRSDCERCAAC